MKLLNDKTFYELKEGDLVVCTDHHEEMDSLMRVIRVYKVNLPPMFKNNCPPCITLKHYKLPIKEAREIRPEYATIEVGHRDKSIFCYEINENETPVMNPHVSFYKVTEDEVFEEYFNED